MKTFFSHFMVIAILVMMFGCHKANDHNEPKVVAYTFTPFSLAGTSCDWAQFDVNLPNINRGEVIVIKDEMMLRNYMVSTNGVFPTIDFSKNTLLLVRGYTTHGISSISDTIQQLSANNFQFDIEITLNNTLFVQSWTTAYMTNRWHEENRIELNVIINQEEIKSKCEDDFYYYYRAEKVSLSDFLLYDWLHFAFDKKIKNEEIIRIIDQIGLFKPMNDNDITDYGMGFPLQPYYDYYSFAWVNLKEQKTCSELKEIIRLLESYPMIMLVQPGFYTYGYDRYYRLSFSHIFTVQVKDKYDLSELHAIAQETNTQIGTPGFMVTEFIDLTANKYSMGNAREMANYFSETRKFKSVSATQMIIPINNK